MGKREIRDRKLHRREFLSVAAVGGVTTGALSSGSRAAAVKPGGEELAVTSATAKVMGAHPVWLNDKTIADFKAGGANVWVFNRNPRYDGEDLLAERLFEELDKYSDQVDLVGSVSDITENLRNNKISVINGWQSAGSLSVDAGANWRVKTPVTFLRMWYELGIRIIGLAYNVANQFSGGCLDDRIGLSKSGYDLVNQMQDMGILVDIGGHVSEQASLDALKISRRPMCCTHSNASTLMDNPRNTSDRVIEGIANTGGVFAISAISDFLTRSYGGAGKPVRRGAIDDFIDHIEYVKRLVGVDYIALGPDFTFTPNALIDPSVSFVWPPEMVGRQKSILYTDGFGNVRKLPDLARRMRARGWNGEEIAKVFGGNWLRVYSQAWNN